MTNAEIRAFAATASPGEVRRRAGITLATLGRALGVNFSTISHWETGRSVPSGPKAAAWCRVIAGLRRHLEVDGG